MAVHGMRTGLLIAIILGYTIVDARGSSVESFTEPYRKVDLTAPDPGILRKLLVKEGDPIEEGQELAVLDEELLLVSLEIARAQMEAHGRLDSAVAERELRKSRLEKFEELRVQGHASQEELERARTDLVIAEANVRTIQEQLKIDSLEYKKTEALLKRRTVRSPLDGVVVRVYKEECEAVPGASATLLTVFQLDTLRITFSVPTDRALTLKVGQQVPLTFESGEEAKGTVELISPVTEADSGTVRVKILLPNPEGIYRCGVRCSLEFEDAPLVKNFPITDLSK